MRFVKHINGHYRIDLTPEEFGYLKALADRTGYPACIKVYPPISRYTNNLHPWTEYPHIVISNRMELVAEEAGFEEEESEDEYHMVEH